MFKAKKLALALMAVGTVLSLTLSSSATALPTATATLSDFIQNGTINNDPASGANITQIVYSLGAPADNLATWQIATAGGIASNFLSDPQFFQTVTWGGLSIAPSDSFSFAGLDIDLIQTLVPLSVSGAVVGGPETLRNASLSIFWNDGSSASSALMQQAWSISQTLTIDGSGTAPEPATLALLGLGLAGVRFSRRKTRQAKQRHCQVN